jgi:hypothetical protein
MEKYSKENLENIIKSSLNKTDVLKKLGNKISGGNFNTLTRYINIYNIDISHFEKNNIEIYTNSVKNRLRGKISLDDILVECSTFSSTHLKKRLYDVGLKERICEKCGQNEVWNGDSLSLILDHINGDHFDNRLENLRILCPNCNATLSTHCRGKRGLKIKKIEKKEKINKIKKKRSKKIYYCDCGEEIRNKKVGAKCVKCYNNSRRIVDRPELDVLLKDIEELGYRGSGKKYGVSDTCIKKWLNIYMKTKLV